MRKFRLSLIVLGAFASSVCGPVLAHHSFAAEFDRTKPVTLVGTLTKIEWQNPHTRLYVDVPNRLGVVTNWELELASPNSLMRVGWTRHSVQVGDKLTVNGFRAKDGSLLANANTIIGPDGRRILSEQASAAAAADSATSTH